MTGARFALGGTTVVADPSGALYWPDERLIVVADLHFEKGSGFASRGTLLPPYDTRETLARLDRVLRRYRPRGVVCLGDTFHDAGAHGRLAVAEAARLQRLVGAHAWTWVVGNHDPVIPPALAGTVADELALGPLTLRHAARTDGGVPAGEVSGHYHPKAMIRTCSRRVSGRCFVTDGRRLILPAFGAFAGGLDVLEPAIARLLRPRFRIFLLGNDRVFAFDSTKLKPPPAWVA